MITRDVCLLRNAAGLSFDGLTSFGRTPTKIAWQIFLDSIYALGQLSGVQNTDLHQVNGNQMTQTQTQWQSITSAVYSLGLFTGYRTRTREAAPATESHREPANEAAWNVPLTATGWVSLSTALATLLPPL